jgi:hypothetical protein
MAALPSDFSLSDSAVGVPALGCWVVSLGAGWVAAAAAPLEEEEEEGSPDGFWRSFS